MARPTKQGLDYYPLDVDFFDDPKLQFVSARFAERGELIAIKLLCKIYRHEGYYMYWNEDMAILFAKGAGKSITHSLANDVVNELLKRDFFDTVMYRRFSILTSNGIQKRYERICRDAGRKFEILKDYRVCWEEIGVNCRETPVLPPGNATKESKVKENKEKESTEDLSGGTVHGVHAGKEENTNTNTNTCLADWQKLVTQLPNDAKEKKQVLSDFIKHNRPAFIEPYATLWNIFAIDNGLAQVQQLTPDRRRKIRIRSQEPFFDFVQCLVQIKKSPFAKGLTNNSTWQIDFDFIIRCENNYVKILEGRL